MSPAESKKLLDRKYESHETLSPEEEADLGDMMFAYSQNLWNEDEEEIIEGLVRRYQNVADILTRIGAAEIFLSSDDGRKRLDMMLEDVLKSVKPEA